MVLTDPVPLLTVATMACLVSVAVTRLMIRVAVLDTPNARSSHDQPVPRGGGLGIAAATLAAWAVVFVFGDSGDSLAWAMVAGAVIVAGIGLLDDLGLATGFGAKLAAQCLAAAILCAGAFISGKLPLSGGWVEIGAGAQILLVLVWVIGMTNAFNFMDGLDALAAGSALVGAIFVALSAYAYGPPLAALTGTVLAAASLGFLVFNRPPAKIFMGDTGSQLLGFVFAALALVAARNGEPGVSPMLVPLLFFHFFFDTAFTLVRRLAAGRPITEAHRSHLYQIMNRLGCSHLCVSLFHGVLTLFQGLGGLWMLSQPPSRQWLAFIPFLALEATYAAILLHLARRRGIPLG